VPLPNSSDNPFSFSDGDTSSGYAGPSLTGRPETSVFAILSVVGGSLSLLGSCCFWYCSFPLSIVVLVLGFVGLNRIQASQGRVVGEPLCWVGISLGLASLFISGAITGLVIYAYLTGELLPTPQ
jgi:hypothetical protein